MEAVVTTGAISHAKLQSEHHHQQTNIQFFYRLDALPVANQQYQSTEWKISHSTTCLPQANLRVFQLPTRKTPLRKPNRGEGIISIKPRPESVYDFLGILYCFIV